MPTSSDDEERTRTDKEQKTRRKLKIEKNKRPASRAAEDDKRKRASSNATDDPRTQQEKEEKLGHRKTKKDVTGQQSTTTKTRRQRTAAETDTLPVFNLGEYQTATTAALSPRLDAIKASVERAHKIKRQAERKCQKQTSSRTGADRDGRRGGGDDEIGTRKTLQTDALLKGKTQFVKLKVHVVDALTMVVGAHTHCQRVWRSQHVTVVACCQQPLRAHNNPYLLLFMLL